MKIWTKKRNWKGRSFQEEEERKEDDEMIQGGRTRERAGKPDQSVKVLTAKDMGHYTNEYGRKKKR